MRALGTPDRRVGAIELQARCRTLSLVGSDREGGAPGEMQQ